MLSSDKKVVAHHSRCSRDHDFLSWSVIVYTAYEFMDPNPFFIVFIVLLIRILKSFKRKKSLFDYYLYNFITLGRIKSWVYDLSWNRIRGHPMDPTGSTTQSEIMDSSDAPEAVAMQPPPKPDTLPGGRPGIIVHLHLLRADMCQINLASGWSWSKFVWGL